MSRNHRPQASRSFGLPGRDQAGVLIDADEKGAVAADAAEPLPVIVGQPDPGAGELGDARAFESFGHGASGA
jgi:hypothetical protein